MVHFILETFRKLNTYLEKCINMFYFSADNSDETTSIRPQNMFICDFEVNIFPLVNWKTVLGLGNVWILYWRCDLRVDIVLDFGYHYIVVCHKCCH